MSQLRTLEEYDIRIQDYKTFNEILEEIYLGLRISQMGTMKEIRSKIAHNENIIASLEQEQKQLFSYMQNSQLNDKSVTRRKGC